MSLRYFVYALIFSALLSTSAHAQWDLAKNVVEYKLPNGMTWLLVRRPTPSVFAGAVELKVGGVDEVPPRVGLAHMFEHMAFKGTREVGTTDFSKEAPLLKKMAELGDPARRAELLALQKEARRYQVPNELFTILTRSGAQEVNAFTSKDVTQYHSEMPSNQLALWLYLYSGMVGEPVLREFYAERDVVLEERRMRVENRPQGKAYEALIQTAFTTSPYRFSTIGSADQIAGLTVPDAMAFYRAYYHPDRMVGALVGDISIPQAKALIARTFGKLPATPSRKETLPEEPPQTAMRRQTIQVDAAPFLLMGFHKPRIGSKADYTFDVIDFILCQGPSSRLTRELVIRKKLAQSVTCANGIPGNRLDNLYYIEAFPIGGHDPDELEKRILAAVAELAEHGVSDDELRKARNNLAADFFWQVNDNTNLADLLVSYQTLTGDWRYVLTHAKHIEAVSNEDIKSAAREYLKTTNLTVVTAL